ncbi:MAG: nitrous oxide reductase family maturation protein NosD [Candidatus Bathyarchaeia archaeon]|jgi:parallel beta-helix repeat protein
MKRIACLLLIALLATSTMACLCNANFFPPPASLQHVYIRDDGSIDPPSVPIRRENNIYTFTEDLSNFTLNIQRSNIAVDGAGHVLAGNSSGQGIVMRNVAGVIIRDLTVRNLREGIELTSSVDCTLSRVTVTKAERGVYLYNSSNNIIQKSTVRANSGDGIVLLDGCNNNSITDSWIADNGNGGISLQAPNTLLNQTACNQNSIIGNNITANAVYGIWILSSSDCLIQRNTIGNSQWGIQLHGENCKNTTIIWNQIRSCRGFGIILAGKTSGNTVAKNTLMWNQVGVDLTLSEDSQFYSNNFVYNYQQVDTHYVGGLEGAPWSLSPRNFWDNGSETGGNYWSDLYRSDDDDDGYIDTPYIVDENNTDHYPLMQTFGNVEGYAMPTQSPKPSTAATPSATASPNETYNPHSTPTFPIEIAYLIAFTIAVVAIATAYTVKKRKPHPAPKQDRQTSSYGKRDDGP